MSYRIDNFIDGETTESRSERFLAPSSIRPPASSRVTSFSAPLMSKAEAIASAERAFADWSQTPPLVRAGRCSASRS